ncbi:MAG: DegT/DnrJ/EryC1/StrS aminotransferase [Alphaproteobacteria bacterium]|nr:MAG: DegT/DnrJ/EryC1/StrS aminotransferase [Alphaproteobacteria bacterium]
MEACVLKDWRIKCLVPDLPELDEVAPFIRRMDTARWYSNFGPLVSEFEQAMAGMLAKTSALPADSLSVASFSSATTALELLFRAAGLKEGARILTPALTFAATASSIRITGHTPVLCDVDTHTWDLTPAIARALLKTHQFDAVLPVAIYGFPVDMDAWAAFQAETGVRVFVDAAAALGQQAVHPDVPVCFSLHATKPFGIGEGGILVTGDAELAGHARRLSNFAFIDGTSREIGTNAKLAEVLAAYGLAQIGRFDAVQTRRREVLDQYLARLGAGRFHPRINDFVPGTLLYDTGDRAQAAVARLNGAGIQTRQWYFPPLRDHAAFAGIEILSAGGTGAMPVVDRLQTGLVGLPFHAFLSGADIDEIAEGLEAVLGA